MFRLPYLRCFKRIPISRNARNRENSTITLGCVTVISNASKLMRVYKRKPNAVKLRMMKIALRMFLLNISYTHNFHQQWSHYLNTIYSLYKGAIVTESTTVTDHPHIKLESRR
jgi:hypothetical protein